MILDNSVPKQYSQKIEVPGMGLNHFAIMLYKSGIGCLCIFAWKHFLT